MKIVVENSSKQPRRIKRILLHLNQANHHSEHSILKKSCDRNSDKQTFGNEENISLRTCPIILLVEISSSSSRLGKKWSFYWNRFGEYACASIWSTVSLTALANRAADPNANVHPLLPWPQLTKRLSKLPHRPIIGTSSADTGREQLWKAFSYDAKCGNQWIVCS